MILTNGYHILGLDNTSSQKQISKRGKDILKYIIIGENPTFENDFFFTNDFRNEIYVKNAVNDLSNPKSKLLDFFFSFDIETEDDKKLYSYINEKKINEIITIYKNNSSKKNLALLYILILSNKNLFALISNEDIKKYYTEAIDFFYNIKDDNKFWKNFEQRFNLFDDLSTNSEIIIELRNNLGKYLSDIFYDVSNYLIDNEVIKLFNQKFKNVTGNNTNNKSQELYLELNKIKDILEKMNISEDGIFDDNEKLELNSCLNKIENELHNLKEFGLYENSKTLIIRDDLSKALRNIMLDLNNNLDDEDEAFKLLNFILGIVGTEGLKAKINEDYNILKNNLELKPIITLLDNGKNKSALELIEKIENESPKMINELSGLKQRAVFHLIGDSYKFATNLFENEKYLEANEKFSKIKDLCKKHIYLFDVNKDKVLELEENIIHDIKLALNGKLNLKETLDNIDGLKESISKKLDDKFESYFIIFFFDSIVYELLSEKYTNKKGSKQPAFLFTLNGVGVSIYGETTFITILWIPILPISSRNVNNMGGNKYQFYGEKEMSKILKWRRNIGLVAILILIFVAIANSDSGNNNYSSNSNSNYNYSTSTNSDNKSSSDETVVGDYSCKSYYITELDKLTPSTVTKNELTALENEISEIETALKNMYVNEYSSQSSIDLYNSKVNMMNSKIREHDNLLEEYNLQVNTYNSYLINNCTKR